eukprot:3624544-Amphidinium_carterae.2
MLLAYPLHIQTGVAIESHSKRQFKGSRSRHQNLVAHTLLFAVQFQGCVSKSVRHLHVRSCSRDAMAATAPTCFL